MFDAAHTFLRNVKICGLTRPEDARLVAALGFGAAGFVFYPRSPRAITPAAARELVRLLPPAMAKVGVFVDMPVREILSVTAAAGLTAVQLHGHERARTAALLEARGLTVIRVAHSARAFTRMRGAGPVLVEGSQGALPGGNGAAWSWQVPNPRHIPFAIAGGLSPRNVLAALTASGAAALDVSSGVESSPGAKSAAALQALAAALKSLPAPAPFW